MLHKSVGLFINSDTVSYHLSNLDYKVFTKCKDYRSVDEFINSQHNVKLAVLQMPFPFEDSFQFIINKLKLVCQKIIILSTELHPPIVDFLKLNDDEKIVYYICGLLNFELKKSVVYPFMDWFETSSFFYRKWLPEILTRLKPFEVKNQSFDILLGCKKLHRDVIYKYTKERPGIGVVTYFNNMDTTFSMDPEHWIMESQGLRLQQPINWTVDQVQYYGHPISLSQILPIAVYNQTAYSVVAETCWQDEFAFFTEKTSKPIIARRLFVMFAGKGYLRNLRKLGFKTFDSIIDETYDDETDALIRWRKAWEQMVWLDQQPQKTILENIKPIVEHNFNVMMTDYWSNSFRQQLDLDFGYTIDD